MPQSPKQKALHAKMGKNSPQARIKHISNEIKKERVSYGELAELQSHKKHILKSGDIHAAEASGISESEWNRYHNKKRK